MPCTFELGKMFESYLNCVGVVGGVLEEAVVGVEHLPGDEEEELTARAT